MSDRGERDDAADVDREGRADDAAFEAGGDTDVETGGGGEFGTSDDADAVAGDGADAGDADDDPASEDGDEPSLAGVFGARSEDAPERPALRPESPSLENAAFVVLGVLLGLFVLYRAAVVLPT